MDVQKKTLAAKEKTSERVQKLRESFCEWQKEAPAKKLVFVDESGSTRHMTRLYGWALSHERLHEYVPRNRGRTITMIGAMSSNGILTMVTGEGGTTGDVFHAFVKQQLLPCLEQGDIVVMDNLKAHKDKRIRPLIESVGAKVYFQPPYSPEFNAIELAWSFIKSMMKLAKPRTREAIEFALAWAIGDITPKMATAWIKHCGFVF